MADEASSKRKLDFSIDWGEVEKDIGKVVDTYRRQVRLPGFRPGKAPPAVVRARHWKDIKQEVIERLLPKLFWERAKEEGLKVVGAPDVADLHFENGEPVTFRAEFDVQPEFELGEYLRLEVPYTEPQVTDDEVSQELERLREQHVSYLNLDPRPLEDGDIAVLSLKSVGDSPKIDQDEMMLGIGEESTLPDFSDNLRGKSPGDEAEFDVKYPDDYGSEQLSGKTVRFHAKVVGLRKKELPELDDEFASEVGNFPSLDELRTQIRESIAAHRRRHEMSTAKDKLVDKLVAQHPFPVPEAMVDRQIANRAERQLRQLAEQGVDPAKLDLDWSKIRDGQREGAVRDVRAEFILERIAEVEAIEVSSDELDEQVRRYAEQNKKKVADARAELAEDGTLDRVKVQMRNEKALNFLFDEAQKVDQEVSAAGDT